MKKYKNMLFVGVGGLYLSVDCTKLIIERYGVDKAYAVVADPGVDTSPYEEILERTIIRGMYSNEKKYLPLDEEILNDYSDNVLETLHMMERDGSLTESYSIRERLYFKHLEFWVNKVKEWKLDCVFFAITPHEVSDFVLYQVCLKNHIPTYMTYVTLIRMNANVMRTYDNQGILIKREYERLKSEYAKTDIHQIELSSKAAKIFSELMERTEDRLSPYDDKDIREIKLESTYYFPVSELYRNWKEEGGTVKTLPNLARRIYWSEKKYLGSRWKLRELIKEYENRAIVPDWIEKFIYFPLHYQPELKTCPLGGYYADQLLAVKMLSYHLPKDIMIYVKEHPAQTPFGRDKEVYGELTEIPRVKLINMKVPSLELMKRCIAISSITGTTGWEGQFYGKPFLMFGTYLTECLENVYRIRTNEDCKKAIEEILNGKNHPLSEKELKLFMKAMDLHSFEYGAPAEIMWPHIKEVMDLEDENEDVAAD